MFKLGRQPRKFDMRIPRAANLMRGIVLPPPPLAVDYSAWMPDDLGEMGNDQLGDCTCAAFYHARQLWSADAQGKIQTDPDIDVLALYSAACGYIAGDVNTDQGGCEQDVLAYLLNTGAPVTDSTGETDVDKILGYVEIDQTNFDDLKRTIADCGVAYIGVDLPQSVLDNADNVSAPWDTGGDTTIAGGHAVILTGYNSPNNTWNLISWGRKYLATTSFLAAHLDEAYAILDHEWLTVNGKTPFGQSLDDLESAMAALKEAV